MQVLHVFYELLAVGKELLTRLLEVLWRLYPCNVESLLHLLEEVGLRHLVTVQFKAEGVESYLCQTALHHLESRHLLCHEEHPLVVIERIGNHVGDGLALSRARRTVEYETLAVAALYNCLELRRVNIHRNGKFRRLCAAVGIPCIHGIVNITQLHLAFHQRAHHLVLLQMVCVVVNVVPHYELVEREQSQQRLLHDIPARHFAYRLSHRREYHLDVNAVLVFRKRVEDVEVHLELLSEQFYQGDVYYDVLLACSYYIVVASLAQDVDRHQQYRRETRHHALLVLIPFQHSQHEEQRVGTVLLE